MTDLKTDSGIAKNFAVPLLLCVMRKNGKGICRKGLFHSFCKFVDDFFCCGDIPAAAAGRTAVC